MTSKIDEYNMALALLGAPAISDTAAPGNAAKITAIYNMCLRSLLESHTWNFAIKRKTLAREVAAPESEYDYKHLLPIDCIRLLHIYNGSEDWAEEDGGILTNDDVVKIIYVSNFTDSTKLPPTFQQVLAYDLAIAIGYMLTQNSKLVQGLAATRERLFIRAKTVDGQKTKTEYLKKNIVKQSMETPYGILDE